MKLGTLDIQGNTWLAPMAGVTDWAFRCVCQALGAAVTVTEMVSSRALKATLQMVNHLVEVAISMSDTAVQELSWFDFLDEINEPELIQYLKERRLYVNEPVSASEEE